MSSKKKRQKHKYKLKGTVTISPIAFLIGLIGLPFFAFLFVMGLKESDLWTRCIFGSFLLMDIYLILSVNWKIDYDSNGFTYRNIFRISRYYRYSDITRIYIDKDSWIEINGKKIRIDNMADGRHFLIQAQRRAKQAQKFSAQDRKLFNGNVRNAGVFVFFFILLIVFIIAALIEIQVTYRPLKLENLETCSVKLAGIKEEYTENDVPYLKLIPEQSEIYFMLYRPEDYHIDVDLLKEEIQNDAEFEIYYEINNENRQIMQIASESKIYLSIDVINAEYAETRFAVSLMIGIILGLWILFGLIANHIMSHAEQYPNAVRLFVQEDYIIKKYK